MKPVDVKSSTYIDLNKENNKEGLKFKVGDNVRISNIKIFLQNSMFQIGFVIKNVKNTVPWTYFISDLTGKEIVGTFYKNELQKGKQKKFKIEK